MHSDKDTSQRSVLLVLLVLLLEVISCLPVERMELLLLGSFTACVAREQAYLFR